MRAVLWSAGLTVALVLIADCPGPLAAVLGMFAGRWVAADPG